MCLKYENTLLVVIQHYVCKSMWTFLMSGSSSLCRPHLKFRCPHTFSHMCMFHLLQWLLVFLWATLFEAWFHHTSACQRWTESIQCCCLFSDKSLPRRPEVPFVSGKIKSLDSTWDLSFEKQVMSTFIHLPTAGNWIQCISQQNMTNL